VNDVELNCCKVNLLLVF